MSLYLDSNTLCFTPPCSLWSPQQKFLLFLVHLSLFFFYFYYGKGGISREKKKKKKERKNPTSKSKHELFNESGRTKEGRKLQEKKRKKEHEPRKYKRHLSEKVKKFWWNEDVNWKRRMRASAQLEETVCPSPSHLCPSVCLSVSHDSFTSSMPRESCFNFMPQNSLLFPHWHWIRLVRSASRQQNKNILVESTNWQFQSHNHDCTGLKGCSSLCPGSWRIGLACRPPWESWTEVWWPAGGVAGLGSHIKRTAATPSPKTPSWVGHQELRKTKPTKA